MSNWGEIFLNPDLKRIMQYAYRKNVALQAQNGANLNRVNDDILEALVKYKFCRFVCSVDGANQRTYSLYRVKGDYDRVIDNIRKINHYKMKYRCAFPAITWQFMAFGHNEHEISKARALAKELDMDFYVKLSWNDLYTETFSAGKDRELIKKESGLGVADRREYEEKFGKSYLEKTCHQLWFKPRINYDGKLLGCTINYWANLGNIFEEGLQECLNGEKMDYARKMVLGMTEEKEGIACSNCKIYQGMKKNNSWLKPKDLHGFYVESRKMNMLRNKINNPLLLSIVLGLVKNLKNRGVLNN